MRGWVGLLGLAFWGSFAAEALDRVRQTTWHMAPAQQVLLRRAVPPPRGGAIAPPLGTTLSELPLR